MVFADHVEYVVAEPFDSFGGTDRAEVYLQSGASG